MLSARPRGSRTPALVLVLLVVLAAAGLYLRSWRLDYARIHPDDPKQIRAARDFIEGDYLYGLEHPSGHIRGYPYFAMHLIEWAYEGSEQVLSHVAPTTPLPRLALTEADFADYLRRLGLYLNCLYELLALGLVYLTGRRLFDHWVGLAAAAVLTVSSLHIQVAHMIGADLPQSLFVFGVFFFCARLHERESLGDWIGAGACAGLAAAAKYSGVLSLLAPALVFLELRRREGWRGAASPRRLGGPLLVLLAFLVAFALATPSVILAPQAGIAAIRSALHASAHFRIPEEYAGRRFAFVFASWYSHLNNFLRFFEPLPGWLTLASVGLFIARRRLRESFLWVYPLALLPVGAYGFPVAVAYHYLGILSPLVWVIGFAFVEIIRALRRPWLRTAAALAVFGGAFAAAVSDTAVFTLPTATELAERWLADCAEPQRFALLSPEAVRKENYPRLLGIDFENFFSAPRAERAREAVVARSVVANFELERRTPALNHIRNRPHRLVWSDSLPRDIELFPPPRRPAPERRALVFPRNLTLSRSPALIALPAGQTFVRRIRRGEDADGWLLYAHYPPREAGKSTARVRLEQRGRWRSFPVDKGGERFIELDLRRTDLLYNGLFSTVRLRSDEPLVAWLVSPQERGWFLLQMERWRELEAWERQRSGWKSEARLAIARKHLGTDAAAGAAAAVEAALPGFRGGEPADLFRTWTAGVGLGIYADPRPALDLGETVVTSASGDLPPELPPGSRLAGVTEHLPPGFYRATWVVSGSGGTGEVRYRVTAEAGRREVALTSSPPPVDRLEVSVPLRITASSPGWDLELSVLNQGSAPVRMKEIRVENDPERQLRWWLGELERALGDRNPS